MTLIRSYPLTRRIFTAFGRNVTKQPGFASFSFLRYNSSPAHQQAHQQEQNASLTAQIYPIDKESITESDVDEWLQAINKLKSKHASAESEVEVYINEFSKPDAFLEEQFEPTEEQKSQIEAYSGKSLPLLFNPTIDNFVNLIMRDGKKSKAQRIFFRALYIVYLKTRRNPVQLLEETLDKLGPLMATKVEKTGNAKNRTVPYPLKKKQRNRYAITWILEGAAKKRSPDYSVRLAEEIVSAYEGKSSGYDRKTQMHKTAMSHRAYIRL